MDSAKTELADKLKTANNILVTVSRNPSVDQLAACIGLTLVLNKLGKHAAAVFSGQVPSTIEFLKPEDTLEKNTDSLRDFIIALDKSKADKLRYKVEDNVVRIFITPYKTSISQADLEFSQGDFNVDVVVALGVQRQEDLDEAITAHGRILHDAAVATINTTAEAGPGSINWNEAQASSLSELITTLTQLLGDNLFDSQIATALLTGIVAETQRFSNDKTSSQTMSASAALMAAGANQQLVATQLEAPAVPHDAGNPPPPDQPPKPDDGTLEIAHDDAGSPDQGGPADQSDAELPELRLPEVPPADQQPEPPQNDLITPGSKLMTDEPLLGGRLTANTEPETGDRSSDPLSRPDQNAGPLLDHMAPFTPPAPEPFTPPEPQPSPEPPSPPPPLIPPSGFTPPPPAWVPPQPDPLNLDGSNDSQTLTDIEESVHSPHLEAPEPDANFDTSNLDAARDEVTRALSGSQPSPEPVQALNAQPLGDILHPDPQPVPPAVTGDASPTPPSSAPAMPGTDGDNEPPQVADPTAPPPVPPPIPFQFRPPGQ